MVLSVGYHGWSSGHLPGYGVYTAPWGNLGRLEKTMRNCYIAGVLLEPMRDGDPPPGYLQGVQDLCRKYQAVFIVDEIVTGFRWATGGATELYGLDPDICCYSKAMANGHPQAAIVGKRAIMEYAEGVSSTFGGTCDGLAAVRATCRVYREEGVIERLWAMGRALMAGMASAGHPMTGCAVHPRFVSEEVLEGDTWHVIPTDVRALTHRMAAQGALCHPAGLNPMFTHTEKDVAQTVEAAHA